MLKGRHALMNAQEHITQLITYIDLAKKYKVGGKKYITYLLFSPTSVWN